jgi:hypothetical protein
VSATRITLSEGEKSLILAQEYQDAPGWQSLARKIRNADRMEQYGCKMTGPHNGHGKCPGIDFPAAGILLCDQCYERASGLPAVCQDYCELSLDHDGECARRMHDGQTHCERCGRQDRLTAMERPDMEQADR